MLVFDRAAEPAMPVAPMDTESAVDVGDLLVAVEERVSVPAPQAPPPARPMPPMVDVPVSLSRMPRVVVSSTSLPATRPSGTYTAPPRIEPSGSSASSLPPKLSRRSSIVLPAPPRTSPPPAPPVTSAPPSGDEEAKLVAQIISLKKIPHLRIGPDALTKLPLDHRAGFVLTLVDGATSVEDIVDASGLPRVDVLRVVVGLIGKGVLGLK
jgi:hypothetical protein